MLALSMKVVLRPRICLRPFSCGVLREALCESVSCMVASAYMSLERTRDVWTTNLDLCGAEL